MSRKVPGVRIPLSPYLNLNCRAAWMGRGDFTAIVCGNFSFVEIYPIESYRIVLGWDEGYGLHVVGSDRQQSPSVL